MTEAPILEATRDNFPQLVLENSRRGLVVLDFWSPSAGPSLRQRDMLTALAREFGGRFLLITVNTDQQPGLSNDYGVKSIPSIKLFRHGKVVQEVRGVQIQTDYRKIIERHGQQGRARRALLAVFGTLGAEHELVRQYRGELFQLIH